MFCTFWLRNVLPATTACTFSTSQLPKVVRDRQFLALLTWKCASRHNGVHFFDISTSKSGPRPPVFSTFDLEMCFAPQRHALFRHLNFQKWSDHGVFCTFWLGNVLRATTARTFSTSQLPKVVWTWGVLYLLTWKCASRHNGVHFFIAPVASWLRTRRFSEPTFRPSWATNHWKNTVLRDFPTFSRICIFCPLTLSLLLFSLLIFLFSLPLPYSAFHLSILSEVWLLNFLRLYIFQFFYPTCSNALASRRWTAGHLAGSTGQPRPTPDSIQGEPVTSCHKVEGIIEVVQKIKTYRIQICEVQPWRCSAPESWKGCNFLKFAKSGMSKCTSFFIIIIIVTITTIIIIITLIIYIHHHHHHNLNHLHPSSSSSSSSPSPSPSPPPPSSSSSPSSSS